MLKDIILREIGTFTRTIHAIVETKFKTLNLKKGQFLYLTRICENPGISAMELSQLLMVDKTTTSKVIQKLMAEDFVVKRQDTDDKRSFQLYPTEKANSAYEIIIEEENRQIELCYKDFTEEEKALALKIIQKMKGNVEDDWYLMKNYKSSDSKDNSNTKRSLR